MWVHVPICIFRGQRRMSSVLLYHLPTYSLETGILTELSCADSQQASVILLFMTRGSTGITACYLAAGI